MTDQTKTQLPAGTPIQESKVTVCFPIETTIGAHSMAQRVEAYAWHLGMTVEVRTVGGWFTKVHYFKVVGSSDAARKLCEFVGNLVPFVNGSRP